MTKMDSRKEMNDYYGVAVFVRCGDNTQLLLVLLWSVPFVI